MAKPFQVHAAPWAYSFPAESARSRPGLAGGHASAPPPPRGAPPIDGRGHGGRSPPSPRPPKGAWGYRSGAGPRPAEAADERGGRRRSESTPLARIGGMRSGDRKFGTGSCARRPRPSPRLAPQARRLATARRRTAVPLCPGLRRIVAGVGHRAARGAASESRSNQQIISTAVRL